jgi:K+-sensing histidine kinase KdpD
VTSWASNEASSTTSSDSGAAGIVKVAGRFRIDLGATAGAGKTVAMLDEGHRRRHGGADVVIGGTIEGRVRSVTEVRAAGIEVVPPQTVYYRGRSFQEMDLGAVLARRPQVVLVDDLAHTNVPGSSSHQKLWQDVLELLESGIDVITTVNVQRLEGVADAVEHIGEVEASERVPDWVVRRADEIEVADSSPALRFLADEAEGGLLEHLRRNQPPVVRELRRIASDVGARWHDLKADDVVAGLFDFAQRQQITQIVLGSSKRSRWQELKGGSVVRRIIRLADSAEVDVHIIARRGAQGL